MPYEQKITGAKRENLARELAGQYREGSSIRQLAKRHELSYGLVHALLVEQQVSFRPVGSTKEESAARWAARRARLAGESAGA